MFTIVVEAISPTKKSLSELCLELKLPPTNNPWRLTVSPIPYKTLQIIEERAKHYGFDTRVSYATM